MLKAPVHPDYPPEAGRFLRGNDYSPVAVAVVLNTEADKVPADLEALVRVAVESGAALAGTIQTENIGFEKMICNIVANPNIRYLILAGPESAGHLTGEALKALMAKGVDEKRRIVGTEAPHPFLFNLPLEFIERFRKQLTLIDLQFEGDPEVLRHAVCCCYQERAVAFRGHMLCDPGAYPEPPLGGRLTWRVTQPWAEPADEREHKAVERVRQMIETLRTRSRRT
jgi:tetrahydromethanopterin S-methyltransferase subunit A